MVYGCAFWPIGLGDKMREDFGFNDSKQVKEKDREKMFNHMKDN
jgi:ribonuclease HII